MTSEERKSTSPGPSFNTKEAPDEGDDFLTWAVDYGHMEVETGRFNYTEVQLSRAENPQLLRTKQCGLRVPCPHGDKCIFSHAPAEPMTLKQNICALLYLAVKKKSQAAKEALLCAGMLTSGKVLSAEAANANPRVMRSRNDIVREFAEIYPLEEDDTVAAPLTHPRWERRQPAVHNGGAQGGNGYKFALAQKSGAPPVPRRVTSSGFAPLPNPDAPVGLEYTLDGVILNGRESISVGKSVITSNVWHGYLAGEVYALPLPKTFRNAEVIRLKNVLTGAHVGTRDWLDDDSKLVRSIISMARASTNYMTEEGQLVHYSSHYASPVDVAHDMYSTVAATDLKALEGGEPVCFSNTEPVGYGPMAGVWVNGLVRLASEDGELIYNRNLGYENGALGR